MARNRYSLGLLIVLIGVVILLGKLGVFAFLGAKLWPLLVFLLPGFAFHALYFTRVLPSGVLIPGGILSTYGLLFLFCNVFGYHWMSLLWPVFILGVAVGLYEFYVFDRTAPKGALVASIILTAIGGVFLCFTLLFSSLVYFIAFGLIAAGAVMVLRRPRSW